ncbi:hypothetical protein VST7929_02894 [Vibrio stylophorae]|uniref:SIS domain-containing protein n=1 Tax=Vibrio stylophorae TaxID=659351 RepID=A0ABM8ZX54_9VIBR|nr:SIS domain-containing protein [Vibrio stylophorae]CAH0535258.1 hypothetical protein VST7929_02894 [Vibrio stylophorae]
MTQLTQNYFNQINQKLTQISQNEAQLKTCGELMAQAVMKGQNLFVFGASHAGIMAEEASYRAGGLAVFNPIFHPSLMLNIRPLTLTTDFENIEGMGHKIVAASPMKAGDILLVHSVSGRNAIGIDIALAAKEKGITLIAITSLATAKRVQSKHSSGQLLCEVVDYVIDNQCDYGDASVSLAGMAQKAAPLSTIMSVTILNCLSLVICETMLAHGQTPPVLASANIDGNQAINQAIFEQYQQQIHYL